VTTSSVKSMLNSRHSCIWVCSLWSCGPFLGAYTYIQI